MDMILISVSILESNMEITLICASTLESNMDMIRLSKFVASTGALRSDLADRLRHAGIPLHVSHSDGKPSASSSLLALTKCSRNCLSCIFLAHKLQ